MQRAPWISSQGFKFTLRDLASVATHRGQNVEEAMNDLAAARLQTVRDHMHLETVQDWDGVIATFAHPRYEMHGGGQAFEGRGRRAQLFRALADALPRPRQRDHRHRP
jgi:hypothetical protein